MDSVTQVVGLVIMSVGLVGLIATVVSFARWSIRNQSKGSNDGSDARTRQA